MSTNRIMVFGGGTVVNAKGQVSLHQTSVERVERTIDYYNHNKELFLEDSLNNGAFILCTGGYGMLSAGVNSRDSSDREAVLMAEHLAVNGAIPRRIILLEQESISTLTNWTRSLELYEDRLNPNLFNETDQLGLVSHPYHLKRVIYLAEKLGYPTKALYKIATKQVDNQVYETAVLTVYKEYMKDLDNPADMEKREEELSNDTALMAYLKNQLHSS